MRSRLLVVAGAALALAPTAAALNPQSAGLQVALRAQGLYLGAIDARVGPATVRGVRTFQRRQGLPPTGLADARTRAALGPLGRPLFGGRTLRRGAFGWDVSVLQFLLARQGLAAPISGYFDVPTARALRTYQRTVHLQADAIVGAATLAALGLQTRVPVRAPARSDRIVLVRRGDTLTSIARAQGTTVAALARLNRLDPAHVLPAGRRLRVPASAPVAASDVLAVRASIDRWAAHYGVDPHLARAVAWMESGYQQHVVSSVGAVGVMQLLPSTWRYVETVLIGRRVERTADGNVRVGVAYLRHLLRSFGGNERLALAAWYQGEHSVRQRGPYAETGTFVANVLALRGRM